MKRHPHLVLGALLIASLAFAAFEGHRATQYRDSEAFFRWMMSAASQLRLEGRVGPDPQDPIISKEPDRYKDAALFARVADIVEQALPDIPLADNDVDPKGAPYPKLVRYSAFKVQEGEGQDSNAQDVQIRQERRQRDTMIWALVSGSALAQERENFLQYRYEDCLWGVGTQFGASDMYASEGAVSLGNMFFGFRKMAANLLWLQVDRIWHEGALFRMVPLMNMTVALDPTFVDAYLIGAWHLAYNFTASIDATPDEMKEYDPVYKARVGEKEKLYFQGIEFLKDGIRKNPRDYRLYFDLGYAIYEDKLGNHREAIRYLSEAIRLKHERWVRRALYRCLQYNGQYEEALAGWQDYREKFGDLQGDVVARFIIYNEALIFERDAQRASWRSEAAERIAKRAEQAGDAAKAAQFQQIAAQAREDELKCYGQAHDKWASLSADDAFSGAHLLGLEARDLVRQKRYLEAIAKLDRARFESGSYFEEASNEIIRIKGLAGEPLTVSEKGAVERTARAKKLDVMVPKTFQKTIYEYKDGVYYPDSYAGQQTQPIDPGTDGVDQVLIDHPELVPVLDIGGDVVVQAGENWYLYHAPKTEAEAPAPSKAA